MSSNADRIVLNTRNKYLISAKANGLLQHECIVITGKDHLYTTKRYFRKMTKSLLIENMRGIHKLVMSYAIPKVAVDYDILLDYIVMKRLFLGKHVITSTPEELNEEQQSFKDVTRTYRSVLGIDNIQSGSGKYKRKSKAPTKKQHIVDDTVKKDQQKRGIEKTWSTQIAKQNVLGTVITV